MGGIMGDYGVTARERERERVRWWGERWQCHGAFTKIRLWPQNAQPRDQFSPTFCDGEQPPGWEPAVGTVAYWWTLYDPTAQGIRSRSATHVDDRHMLNEKLKQKAQANSSRLDWNIKLIFCKKKAIPRFQVWQVIWSSGISQLTT